MNPHPVTVDGILAAEDEQHRTNGRAHSEPMVRGYLEAVHEYLCRYVAFPSEHEPTAIALWVAHTHLIHRFDISPILAITSAEMRSGKTLVFDCLEFIVAHPERMVTPSPAATYTAMSQDPRPTLLLDEADAIFTRKRKGDADTEGLRAVFNAGNRRGQTVARVEMQGKRRVLERLDVYGAKAIAGIGYMPDTITDRSIVIRMRRKAPGDTVERFRLRRVREVAATITAPDWASVALVADVAEVGGPMNDRSEDSWHPLLIISEAAGGDWPARARAAALALSGDEDAHTSLGVALLRDIHTAMGSRDHLRTPELLDLLHEMDEAPWADYYGKPLTARRLATLLEPYDITPRHERLDGDDFRGYFRSDFEDAWIRYLPSAAEPLGAPPSATSATTATDREPDTEPIWDDYPSSAWDIER